MLVQNLPLQQGLFASNGHTARSAASLAMAGGTSGFKAAS
jgi:hypothetical protein